MSDLEKAAQPVLERPIRREASTFATPHQTILATWALKTALVFQASQNVQIAPTEHFSQLRQRRTPARQVAVWLGAHHRARSDAGNSVFVQRPFSVFVQRPLSLESLDGRIDADQFQGHPFGYLNFLAVGARQRASRTPRRPARLRALDDGQVRRRRSLRQLGRLARRLRAHPIRYRLQGQRRVLDETALAGIAYSADVNIGQLPAIVRAALQSRNRPLIAAARALMPLSGSQAPAGPPNLALAASIGCNDYPPLWDRRAPVSVRLRQFAARRARLAQSSFRPFSARAWTSAIIDRGNACIRWPDPRGRFSAPRARSPTCPHWSPRATRPQRANREGRQAARQFPHAQFVEVPNAGHVPEGEATGCAASITFDFIPNQRLGDTSCLAKIPPATVP